MFAKRIITRLVFTSIVWTSLFFSSLGTTPVYAAGITVNTAVDEKTKNGKCSLREAIENANNNAATHPDCAVGFGVDTITFAGNYTITLGAQLPAITSTIIIKGKGAAKTIIQANASPDTATYRVFMVSGGAGDLTLNSLTVRHGRCNGSCEDRPNEGGGIYNNDSLTVTNSTISGNSADAGGGISNHDGSLTVTNSTISGNSAAVVGGGIYSNDSIVTVTNSTFSGNSAADNGGGIHNDDILSISNSTFSGNSSGENGGGIYNYGGSLTVTGSIITGNSSDEYGGGIYNYNDSLTVTNSTFSGNSASNGGGGVSHSDGPLTVTNSTFSGNSAEHGGGIRVSNSLDLNISSSTFSGNNASTQGGGIYNNGSLNVLNSTLSGNSATADGGGIYNNSGSNLGIYTSTVSGNIAGIGGGISNDGNLWLGNVTISGNQTYDYGGGIYSDGSAWIHNSTIAFNTLIYGTDLGAGGIDGDVALYNSLVAGNTRALTSGYRDCSGTIYIEGVNLFWDMTNCSINPASPGLYGSLFSLNELGPLQDNGGPTWTHALIPVEEGSRAIDAGDNTLCTNWPINNLDQRGVARPQGSRCDIGAYESVPTFLSIAGQDGWILESSETSSKGGSKNDTAAAIRLGDNAANKQYRGILSFDTSAIPDGAIINKVTLKVKNAGVKGGGNPVNLFKGFMVDVKTGEFGVETLELADFKTAGDLTLGPLKPPLVNGWYSLDLTAANLQINTTGNTQIRLRFKLDDNNNLVANYLTLYSGDAALTNQPLLIVEYTAP